MVYGEDWEIRNGTPYFYRVWDANKELYAKDALQTTHNISAQGNLGKRVLSSLLLLIPTKKVCHE